MATLKRVRPDLTSSWAGRRSATRRSHSRIVQLADYVITGEADLTFAELCRRTARRRAARPTKIIPAELPEFCRAGAALRSLRRRRTWRTASSTSRPRAAARSRASSACRRWTSRCGRRRCRRCSSNCSACSTAGVRQFKFVDRTFNLNLDASRAILEFLLERHQPGHFFHFEMIPDRLPEALREVIARFPPGALQFEVGVQTFNEEVARADQPPAGLRAAGGQLPVPARADRGAYSRRSDCRAAGRERWRALRRASTGWSRSGRRKSRWASSSGCAARRSSGTTPNGRWSITRIRPTRSCRTG